MWHTYLMNFLCIEGGMKDELDVDFDTQISVPLIKKFKSLSARFRTTF
jgi:hypothetical protein